MNPISGLRVTKGTAEQAGIAYAALWQAGRFLSRRSWQRRGLQGLQSIRGSRISVQTRLLIDAAAKPTARHSEQNNLNKRTMRDRAKVEATLERADALVEQQDPNTGAFTSDKEADGLPSRTAYLATRIADAWTMALACGQRRRARRYQRSWTAAIGWARQLILRSVDAPMLREAVLSVGGVRVSKANALITIDAAGHLIVALTKGLEAMKVPAH
jgi:hypothetical protein